MKFAPSALFAALALLGAGSALAAPVLMSEEWARDACEAWNKDNTLTTGLVENWIGNNKGRGYKVIHMYRTDCADAARVEMTIVPKDGKAMCSYGGKIQHDKLDSGADYLMHATTARWKEMGAGEYGPMRAMMFGRLNFDGPKMEAMGVMGPFESFLLLAGKVPSDTGTCPK